MTDAWMMLADAYARNRIGYSNELFDTIAQFGLRRGATILDVGCGTGLASAPFISNGFPVTGVDSSDAMLAKAKESAPQATFMKGEAEALPFPNERFDVVISAQTFHWIDRTRALAEAHRVMRPGGMIAVWWKHLMGQDPVKRLRDDTLTAIGKQPKESGLPAGFKEFYASPFVDQLLRVIPWRTTVSLDTYMGYERSRCQVRQTLGDSAELYYGELEARMRERFGHDNPSIPLSYVQYLYLAKKR